MAFSITPLVGSVLTARSTSPTHKLLTSTFGDDGREYVYARAMEAIASGSSVFIRDAGSASSRTTGSGATFDAGPAGNGGVTTAAPYFWARKTAI